MTRIHKVPVAGLCLVPDSDGFAGCVCPYSRRLTDSFVVPSSATIASLPDSTPGCSYVVLRFAAETVVRILFNRQPRIRGRGRAAAPCFRLSTAQVQSSTVPTGVWPPEPMRRAGFAFLSGAHAIPVQRKLMTLSQADCLAGWFSFSRRVAAVPQFRACRPPVSS